MLWTIEVNLSADVTCCTAYHIDTEEQTIERHISAAINGKKLDNWAYIGHAKDHTEAHEICAKFQNLICEEKGLKAQTGWNKFEQKMIAESNAHHADKENTNENIQEYGKSLLDEANRNLQLVNSWKNPQDEKPKKGRIVKILCRGKIYFGKFDPEDWETEITGCNWIIIEDNFPSGGIIEGWKEMNEQ